MSILKDVGNPDNEGVSQIEDDDFAHRPGKIVVSSIEAESRPALIVTETEAKLIGDHAFAGVYASNGIVTQGTIHNTSKGENISKGEFSENPRSKQIFTYSETIGVEGDVRGALAEVAGKLGINTGDLTKDGIVPLMTNIALGPLPHVHTMLFKHVHRTEPAYLYRVPGAVQMFQGAMDSLKNFFQEPSPSGPLRTVTGVRG